MEGGSEGTSAAEYEAALAPVGTVAAMWKNFNYSDVRPTCQQGTPTSPSLVG